MQTRTKSKELMEFEATTTTMVKSHKYTPDAPSLARRIHCLRQELIAKQQILKEWEQELDRKLNRTQTKIDFNDLHPPKAV